MSNRGCAIAIALSCVTAMLHAQTPTPATPPAPPAKPQCSVSDVPATVPASALPPELKKNAAPALAEDVRKQIFIELQQIVARARREAGAAYPTGERAPLLSPTDVEKPGKLSGKRETMTMSLERSYIAELLTRRSLACAAARDIMREGRAAGWPVAKLEERREK